MPERMTILLVSQVFPPKHGGSGRWLWELYRRLAGTTVHVAAGEVAGAETFDRAAPLGISRLDLEFSSWGLLSPGGACDYAGAFLALRRIVQRCKPDVIHCGKALPEGLLALALSKWTGVPYACYVHGEELTLAKTSRELRMWTGRVLRSAQQIVANSRHSRDILLGDWAIPAARIVVIHPGVDTSRFVPAPIDEQVRERLGWRGRRVILTVGALQKRKGQDMMIRALPAIRAMCPDVLYAIAGEGWEREYLEKLVVEQGVSEVVQFCGAPQEGALLTYYQQCDLFALPNRQIGWDLEGFGIVSLEAQACGKPVIVGNSGGAPETVLQGITGEVVSAETPEPLAELAAALLDDQPRREAMGRSGRERAVAQFDWTILARQAEDAFARGRAS